MKNSATFKNEICLIAGSGLFVYEVANFLNNKNLLNQVILINENNLIKKKFKDKCKSFKIKDIENEFFSNVHFFNEKKHFLKEEGNFFLKKVFLYS